MIIRNNTTKETSTLFSLNNRGYERGEHPWQANSHVARTLKECPVTPFPNESLFLPK